MPNYNITIDSRFDPYSFEDYLKPLAILQEQHNQAADAYATALANSAGMEEALAANPDDIDLLNQYNAYRQTLDNLADDLSKNGISRTTRRGVYQAKADYGNIAKMQEAIKQREALIAEQRALQAKDNSIMFDRSAPGFSIRDILSGKSNYATVSRNAITADVQDRLKNWAKSTYLRKNPDFEKKYGYIFQKIESGNKLDTIELAKLANYDGNDPVVNAMRDVVRDTVNKYSSTSNLWDNDAIESMRKAAYAGLDSTLGTADWSHMQDIEAAEARSRASSEKPYVGSKWNWIDVLSAKNGIDLYGSDDRQIAMATNIANHFNKNTTMPKYDIGVENFQNNLKDYLTTHYGDKDGNIPEDKKLAACAMLIESGMDYGTLISTNLMPQKYKDIFIKAQNNNISVNKEFEGANAMQKAKDALMKDVKKQNKEGEYKALANEFADYVNKGAVYSEGAFYVGADTQKIYDNIMNYLGDPKEAARFKGQNLEGEFIESLDAPIDTDDFRKDLLDDKTNKIKDYTRIGFFTDAQGHLVAVMKNGDNAYQFDLTNARGRNFKVQEEQQLEYQKDLSMLKAARKIRARVSKGEELTENERALLAMLQNNFPSLNSPNSITDEVVEALKTRANSSGKPLYDALFDTFTLEQKGAQTNNTMDRYPKING